MRMADRHGLPSVLVTHSSSHSAGLELSLEIDALFLLHDSCQNESLLERCCSSLQMASEEITVIGHRIWVKLLFLYPDSTLRKALSRTCLISLMSMKQSYCRRVKTFLLTNSSSCHNFIQLSTHKHAQNFVSGTHRVFWQPM